MGGVRRKAHILASPILASPNLCANILLFLEKQKTWLPFCEKKNNKRGIREEKEERRKGGMPQDICLAPLASPHGLDDLYNRLSRDRKTICVCFILPLPCG